MMKQFHSYTKAKILEVIEHGLDSEFAEKLEDVASHLE